MIDNFFNEMFHLHVK